MELIKQLLNRLRALDEGRIANVVELRLGILDEREHTLEAIGQAMRLSRERVRQIEARGINHIIVWAEESGITDMETTIRELKRNAHMRRHSRRVVKVQPALSLQDLETMWKEAENTREQLQLLGITVLSPTFYDNR